MTDSTSLAKIWNIVGIVRASGVSQLDYIRQLTYLLFLKMESESQNTTPIPEEYNWESLLNHTATIVEHYEKILDKLKTLDGKVGAIFKDASNAIKDPATLQKVISIINSESWYSNHTDNGAIYESILDKNGNDKGDAGQYFTPRALINTIVKVVQPTINETVLDPACGTGGFLLATHRYFNIKNSTSEKLIGYEITPLVVNLGAMNMYLHGIDSEYSYIDCRDSLASKPDCLADVVLANPPFGSRSKEINTVDFEFKTSNNQLNFLQYIMATLKEGGRAGVVLPDNVLFISGAGEKIREKLLKEFNLHTILRLPTGIFYAGGVQSNVLFFTKGIPTKETWIYDYRIGIHHTLKENPLEESDLEDFVTRYNPADITKREETYSKQNPNGRWRKYTVEDLLTRPALNLNMNWMHENQDSMEDYTLDELLTSLQKQSQSILNAVNSLVSNLNQ